MFIDRAGGQRTAERQGYRAARLQGDRASGLLAGSRMGAGLFAGREAGHEAEPLQITSLTN